MLERFLTGRVAMVTGGVSGMGRAMALAFARAGADVAIGSLLSSSEARAPEGEIVYRPGEAELRATVESLESCGVRVHSSNLDVTSMESMQAFHDSTMAAFGKIDILANAAGITAEQTICGHPDELWNRVLEVNLHGTYRAIKLVLPGMMQRGFGRIVNIASTAASVGAPTSAAYSASKAAVIGLTRCVALEGAPRGVTCNSISPGWVETSFGKDWMNRLGADPQGRTAADFIRETNPQKRIIQPEEIGALAVFLCHDNAFGITMQDITVSGGALL